MRPTIGFLLAALSLANPRHAMAQSQQPQAPTGVAPWTTPALTHVPMPSWLVVSGEVRARVESRNGLGYRAGIDDSYVLVRTRINADVRPHSLVRVSFQGQDARAPGINTPTGVFRDPFDVRQAYLRVGPATSTPVAVTVGRQLLSYADQRLIGALDWTNTSRAFDAAKVELRTKWFDVDAFTAAVVLNDPSRQLNESDFDNALHGVYGRVRTGMDQLVVEPFFLWRESPAAGAVPAADRYSLGARLVSRTGRVESAAVYVEQWGERGASDVSARAVLLSTTFAAGGRWSPRLYGEYNYASGDSDPADGTVESFDDMYATAHLYYGYNDLVGLRNLHNVRVGASAVPWRRLNVAVDFHTFALASANDHLYNSAGVTTVQAPTGGAPSKGVGQEVDLTLTVPIAQTLTFMGGVGRFFPGAFVEANTEGASYTFSYAALTVRF